MEESGMSWAAVYKHERNLMFSWLVAFNGLVHATELSYEFRGFQPKWRYRD